MLGPEHRRTLTIMVNLASTYWHQERWKDTEEIEKQVTETRKGVLGADHPDTLNSMSKQVSTYWKQSMCSVEHVCSES